MVGPRDWKIKGWGCRKGHKRMGARVKDTKEVKAKSICVFVVPADLSVLLLLLLFSFFLIVHAYIFCLPYVCSHRWILSLKIKYFKWILYVEGEGDLLLGVISQLCFNGSFYFLFFLLFFFVKWCQIAQYNLKSARAFYLILHFRTIGLQRSNYSPQTSNLMHLKATRRRALGWRNVAGWELGGGGEGGGGERTRILRE